MSINKVNQRSPIDHSLTRAALLPSHDREGMVGIVTQILKRKRIRTVAGVKHNCYLSIIGVLNAA